MWGTIVGLQRLDRAGPLVEALGLHAVLDAAREEDLHADADAHHRAAAGQPAVDDPVAARLLAGPSCRRRRRRRPAPAGRRRSWPCRSHALSRRRRPRARGRARRSARCRSRSRRRRPSCDAACSIPHLQPHDARDETHRGADREQHDEALRHLLLDEGEDPAEPGRGRRRSGWWEAVHSAPFVEGRMPAARGSRSEA